MNLSFFHCCSIHQVIRFMRYFQQNVCFETFTLRHQRVTGSQATSGYTGF